MAEGRPGVRPQHDPIAACLAELLAATPGIEAATIVDLDGLPLYAAGGLEGAKRVAHLVAGVFAAATSSLGQVHLGSLDHAFIKGTEGAIVVLRAGVSALLVAFAVPEAKLGVLLAAMYECAGKVSRYL